MEELKSKKLLSRREAAEYLGICLVSLSNLIKHPNFPALVRIGYKRGRVFINREVLDRWIDEQTGAK